MSKPKTERVELQMEELEAIVERTRAALSEDEHRHLKAAVSTLARLTQELENKRTSIRRLRHLLFGPRSENSATVLKRQRQGGSSAGGGKRKKTKRQGHGRNGAKAYRGANRVEIAHESLRSGNPCPHSGCPGKVYDRSDPGVIVRIQGMPPLGATVYELEKLRCNLCGAVYTAQAPDGVGENKYDETAASMVANLKYGAGFPFHRLEKLQGNLGIPLPAATQWDMVHQAARQCEPAFEALVDAAAQGEVLHNDDTPMKILDLLAENHEPDGEGPKRTGLYTTGIISQCGAQLIALFFTGRHHAGENLEQVLAKCATHRDAPIQMCDALSRNLPGEFKTILANCLSHGRRRFVDVVDNFPEPCRYILETLGTVYAHDAVARREQMSLQQRLTFHQTRSEPLMQQLHAWLKGQLAEKKVEPNSGLGQAISYMLNHWKALTLFLREPGAPLDNNICERALNKAILHRKNSLFYKTQNGARVGDIFMSLIYTAELSGADPFDYLCALQRNTEALAENPGQWLPWNYRQTLAQITDGLAGEARPQAP